MIIMLYEDLYERCEFEKNSRPNIALTQSV